MSKGRRRDDLGLSMVEAVFTIPVVMLMIFGILQAGMWWYARQVALTAAHEAGRAARAYDGTEAAGVAKADRYLASVQGDSAVLVDPQVDVARDSTTVTVRVRGEVVSIFPGLSVSVDVTSVAPVERWIPVP